MKSMRSSDTSRPKWNAVPRHSRYALMSSSVIGRTVRSAIGGPLLASCFVDGECRGRRDVERADPTELRQEHRPVHRSQDRSGHAMVLVAEHEAHGRPELALVQ